MLDTILPVDDVEMVSRETTKTEQEMIAEAIAEGQVTVCKPEGTKDIRWRFGDEN